MEPVPEKPDDVLGFDLAPTGPRLSARLIDTMIGFAVTATTIIAVVGFGDLEVDPDSELDLSGGEQLVLSLVPILLWGLYEILLIRTRGQTVGKMVMRIKVISNSGDDPPLWNAAVMRWAVLALPYALLPDVFGLGVFLLIGLWFLWDGSRQGLHDKAASTYVVKVPSTVPEP